MSQPNLSTATKLLLSPIIIILKRLLPAFAKNKLKQDSTRDLIVKQADALLLAEVPAAAIVPRAARHRLIRHVLNGLLDNLLLSEIEAGLTPLAATGVEGMGVAPPESVEKNPFAEISLGVRGITIRLTSVESTDDILQKVSNELQGWQKPHAMEELTGFYTVRPPEDLSQTVSDAWNLAYKLTQIEGIQSAEPAIRQLPEVLDLKELGSEAATAAGPIVFIKTFGMQDHRVPETKANPEWSLRMTYAEAIWDEGNQGKDVLIGHVDTGYTEHPETILNIRNDLGYDTWDDDADAKDDLNPSWWDKVRATMPVTNPGHGTGTGSVIASPQGWQVIPPIGPSPVWGTAPKASIIPIRATPSVVILPTGSLDEVAQGIIKAVKSGAWVISMSLGTPWGADELELAVQYALDHGVIVCAAAGNVVLAESWLTAVTYPAAYHGVIAVAGCDYFYRPWRDTCRGREVVVTAPGTDVWRATAELNGFWPWEKKTIFSSGQGSGTSFAVATVAGIAACWLNYWGGWDSLLKKLGDNPRSIPEAFLECIRQHKATNINIPNSTPPDLPDYPDFDSHDFGKGVINAQELVKIDPVEALKQKHAATAVPLVAPAFQVSAADKILSDMLRLLPKVDIKNLRLALASDLGLTESKLNTFLESHGRELLHHFATSSALRTRLRDITGAQPPSPIAAAAALAVKATAVPFENDKLNAQLGLRGSDELRKDLSGVFSDK